MIQGIEVAAFADSRAAGIEAFWLVRRKEALTSSRQMFFCATSWRRSGSLVRVPHSAAKELESWHHSERMARGIIVSTAVNLHLELVHKHRQGSPWALWVAIKAKHVKQKV